MELYALELVVGFQQHLAHMLSSWLVSQVSLIYEHLVEQGVGFRHKTTIWNTSWGLPQWHF